MDGEEFFEEIERLVARRYPRHRLNCLTTPSVAGEQFTIRIDVSRTDTWYWTPGVDRGSFRD